MAETNYDKLVRDRIPQIIENAGKQCVTHEVSEGEEKSEYLVQKIEEELEEYKESGEKEELADLLEAFYALIEIEGVEMDELERIRRKKKDKRGGFDEGIILEQVQE
ncbi:MAG: nucleoside triphosphate pyrophosphohydrolase [bacterium]